DAGVDDPDAETAGRRLPDGVGDEWAAEVVGVPRVGGSEDDDLQLSVRLRPRPPRSLFDSMSNHIAKSVNCEPKIRSSATSTTVPAETALPSIRSTTSKIPRARPSRVITKPKM